MSTDDQDITPLHIAAAHWSGWQWADGMKVRWQSAPASRWWEVRLTDDRGTWELIDDDTWGGDPIHGSPVPDLSDPPTGGAMFYLLGPGWCCQRDDKGWTVWGQICGEVYKGSSQGEACARAMVALDEVAALEAAR